VKRGVRTGLVLCCFFAAALLFSGFFILFHGVHDCPGEGCPLCLLVRGTPDLSRQLKPVPAFPAFSLCVVSRLAAGFSVFCAAPASSVRLKVKINR
jgi:hypothetical protein